MLFSRKVRKANSHSLPPTSSPFNTPARIGLFHLSYCSNKYTSVVLTTDPTCDVATDPLTRGPKLHIGYSRLSLFCLFFYPCLCPGVYPQFELEVDVKESPNSCLLNSLGRK